MPIEYNYTINDYLYGSLTLHNNDTRLFNLSCLIFITNANIDINNSSTYFGSLLQEGAILQKSSTDNKTYRYQLTQPSTGFSLLPMQASYLNYYSNPVYGPLQIAMDPVTVSISSAQNSSQFTLIDIVGKCQGEACFDPHPGYRLVGHYLAYAVTYSDDPIPGFDFSKLGLYQYDNVVFERALYFDEFGDISLLCPSDNRCLHFVTLSKLNKQYPYQKTGFSVSADFGTSYYSLVANTSALNRFVDQVEDLLETTQAKTLSLYLDEESYVNFNNYPDPMYTSNGSIIGVKTALSALNSRPSRQRYDLSTYLPGQQPEIKATYQNDSSYFARVYNLTDYILLITDDYDFVGTEVSNTYWSDVRSPMLTPMQDPNVRMQNQGVVSTIRLYQQLANNTVDKFIPMIPSMSYLMVSVSSTLNNCLWQDAPSAYGVPVYYRSFYDNSDPDYIPEDMVVYDPSNDENAKLTGTSYACSQSSAILYSFDTNVSALIKGRFFVENGLQGALVYPLDADLPPDSSGSIARALLQARYPIPSMTPSGTPTGTTTRSATRTMASTISRTAAASMPFTATMTPSSSMPASITATLPARASLSPSSSASLWPVAQDNNNQLSLGLGLGIGLGLPLLFALGMLAYCWRISSQARRNLSVTVFRPVSKEGNGEAIALLSS